MTIQARELRDPRALLCFKHSGNAKGGKVRNSGLRGDGKVKLLAEVAGLVGCSHLVCVSDLVLRFQGK